VLEIFRRPRPQTPAGPDGPGDRTVASHVFPKLLKRLALVDRPTVLDLGRLSGANIEIFARLGCRVQVEDLVSASDERAGAGAHTVSDAPPEGGLGSAAATMPPGSADADPESGASSTYGATPGVTPQAGPATAQGGRAVPGSRPAGTAVASGTVAPSAGVPPAAGPSTGAPTGGARPSRRIVLPPRQFGRGSSATGSAGSARSATHPEPTPLSAGFSYADGSFDAILAWDLVNYYEPQAARRLAGEMCRILRPGGLIYGWLHSRSAGGPDGPRRFRIVDENRIVEGGFSGRPMHRHLYQNRDIQKMFVDVKIVEMYFQGSGVREMLLEKRAPGAAPPPAIPAARPRSRFRIE
jgi:hypothetical protein